MLRVSFRNLFQNRIRFLISALGTALALLLILSFDAVFFGLERQITAYIDYSGADIIVSQREVRNLHMASSTLPATTTDLVATVEGVEIAVPILYAINVVKMGEDPIVTYVIGLPPNAPLGFPWQIAQGTSIPENGQAVVDFGLAVRAGLEMGSRVETMGESFSIAGLSEGTSNFMNSISFISFDDFARIRRTSETISFVLVRVVSGESVNEVKGRIEAVVPNVTVQLRQEFANQERQIVKDMSSDVVNLMNIIGFLIGLAVIALTSYIATFSRRTEYGLLKALGMRGSHLYSLAFLQALITVALGLLLAFAFTLLLAAIVPRFSPNMNLEISLSSLFRLSILSILIAGLGSILPIRQIAELEPATIVRGVK
jgi:putative ABC transport system permease protein